MRVIWVNVQPMGWRFCFRRLVWYLVHDVLEEHRFILECHSFSVSWPGVLKGVGLVTGTRFLLSHLLRVLK